MIQKSMVGGATMDQAARFKHQRILAAMKAGQWLTTAEFFAAAPRTLIRFPWQANAWVDYLARKKMIEINRSVTPFVFCRPAEQPSQAGTA